jgi:type IV pilus assembly protein PilC
MKPTKKLTNNEIASFCSQTAMILKAGITPVEGMTVLLSDTKDQDGRKILQQILDCCSNGNSFCEAVTSTDVFPSYVVHMIHIGEESGNLDDVMQSLADYYERQEYISESVRNAVSYPFIMILMMLLVVLVLITKILPIFEQVFEQLGSEMNGFARSLLILGNAISSYAFVFTIILAAVVVLYIYFTKTASGRTVWSRFLMKFPPTRSFYDSVASGRFANGIALTLASGLDTYGSLDLVSELVDNPKMQAKIDICKKAIEGGANFAEALSKAEIFSNLYSRMVAVAFKSGSVDVVMNKIADDYERDIDRRIHNNISILEPTLVIILSVIVGLILLSVILPLMGIMTSIG